MSEHTITVLPGDGIGPEVTAQARAVLEAAGRLFGHRLACAEAPVGGAALDAGEPPLPPRTLRACRESDAVLLGAVGGPKWDGLPAGQRPEQGLLALRRELGLYANLRPARLLPALAAASPLRTDIAAAGFDFLVVRELTGGAYFGEHKTTQAGGVRRAADEMAYTAPEIERIARTAFEAARGRRKKVTSVDKANVLDTSRLWRAVTCEVAAGYPDVALEHMLVDNAAMQLVLRPGQFDVILTENLFGDILTDEASALTGSVGLVPSASLPAPGGGPGLFEPVHGSAPGIAGTGKANPVGAILSAAMLLRHGLGLAQAADAVERAVDGALAEGARTADLAAPGEEVLSCAEMGGRVLRRLPR